MNKEEAIDFVQEELYHGRSIEQICETLSEKLGAPRELVKKFVEKTAADYQQELEQLIETSKTPTEEALEGFTLPKPETSEIVSTFLTGSPEAAASAPAPVKLESVQASLAQPAPPADSDQLEQEELILRELSRQRKRSDVVLSVCQETGMDWNQAQKLVARVAARNQKKLVKKQNMVVIPLSVIALIIGLILIVAGVSEAISSGILQTNFSETNVNELDYLYGLIRQLAWALIVGLVLSVGGLAGLVIAIRKQMA
jgi:hypothetical protein